MLLFHYGRGDIIRNINYQYYFAKVITFVTGGMFALFGEFNQLFKVLIVFMIVDYFTGTILASIGLSSKTGHGYLSSNQIWIGIAKKVGVLTIIMIAKLIGDVMSFERLRDIVILGYITFELTSLLEHAKVLGIPLPKALLDILEVLNNKEKEGIEID